MPVHLYGMDHEWREWAHSWAQNTVTAYATLMGDCSQQRVLHPNWMWNFPTRTEILGNYSVRSGLHLRVALVIDVVGGGKQVLYESDGAGHVVAYSRRPNDQQGPPGDKRRVTNAWQRAINAGTYGLEPCVAFPSSLNTRRVCNVAENNSAAFPFPASHGHATRVNDFIFTELDYVPYPGDIRHGPPSPLTNYVLVTSGTFSAILRIRIQPGAATMWAPGQSHPDDRRNEYRRGSDSRYPVESMPPSTYSSTLGHFMPGLGHSLGHRAQRVYGQTAALGGAATSSSSLI